MMSLPVGLSNRHIHLSKQDINTLFGEGYQLNPMKDLSQPGQFACKEKVDLVGPKGTIKGVRVLGPARKETQIEISFADGFALGVKAPIADSGMLEGSPGVKLIGPEGEVDLEKGLIIAARHIHMTPDDAEKFGVEDKDIVKVRTFGERAVVFENVLIRVNKDYWLEMHIDLEEGNAAGLSNCDIVELIK